MSKLPINNFSINDLNNSIYRENFDKYELIDKVKMCPKCGKGIYPNYVSHVEIRGKCLVVIYMCPLCEEIIIAKFVENHNNVIGSSVCWKLEEVLSNSDIEITFSKIISTISPQFCEVYIQSQQAEKSGLDEICGVGYRKALEFLIKDYAVSVNPDEEDNIKKRPLKQCIDAYIDYPQIKSCATGAVFIGNDETHYIRKWENKDIKDLKQLISMTTLWIELVEETKHIQKDMGV